MLLFVNKKAMTRALLLSTCLMMLALTGCSQIPSIDDLAWLEGKWERTNAKPGTVAEEHWQRNTNGELRGIGFTKRGADTAFVERLVIKVIENEVYYSADVAHNQAPVLFKMITNDGNKVVFENKEHDFPNQISYELLENGELKAQISGKGRTIDFPFRRLE